jgi:hypothetical protein
MRIEERFHNSGRSKRIITSIKQSLHLENIFQNKENARAQ